MKKTKSIIVILIVVTYFAFLLMSNVEVSPNLISISNVEKNEESITISGSFKKQSLEYKRYDIVMIQGKAYINIFAKKDLFKQNSLNENFNIDIYTGNPNINEVIIWKRSSDEKVTIWKFE